MKKIIFVAVTVSLLSGCSAIDAMNNSQSQWEQTHTYGGNLNETFQMGQAMMNNTPMQANSMAAQTWNNSLAQQQQRDQQAAAQRQQLQQQMRDQQMHHDLNNIANAVRGY